MINLDRVIATVAICALAAAGYFTGNATASLVAVVGLVLVWNL